jgi:hypothetical protein
MSAFKDFERAAVSMLVGRNMSESQLESFLDSGSVVSYKHTGVGYFLTVRHSTVPSERVTCHRPLVIGKADDVECGFVVFLGGGELTLECHSLTATEVPEDFRERPVEVATAA